MRVATHPEALGGFADVRTRGHEQLNSAILTYAFKIYKCAWCNNDQKEKHENVGVYGTSTYMFYTLKISVSFQ